MSNFFSTLGRLPWACIINLKSMYYLLWRHQVDLVQWASDLLWLTLWQGRRRLSHTEWQFCLAIPDRALLFRAGTWPFCTAHTSAWFALNLRDGGISFSWAWYENTLERILVLSFTTLPSIFLFSFQLQCSKFTFNFYRVSAAPRKISRPKTNLVLKWPNKAKIREVLAEIKDKMCFIKNMRTCWAAIRP